MKNLIKAAKLPEPPLSPLSCLSCGAVEQRFNIGGIALTTIFPHSRVCADCVNRWMREYRIARWPNAV